MSDTIHLNQRAESITESPAYQPFSGVRVIVGEDEDGNQLVYTAGDDSFRVLEVSIPWGTQQIATSIYNKIKGYAYKPYTAKRSLLDPAAELGDAVYVGNVYSLINATDTELDQIMAATISAKEDGTLEHEYHYEPKADREIKRKINNVETSLTVEMGLIESRVAETYETKTAAGAQYQQLSSTIAQTAQSITASVSATYETKTAAATMKSDLQSQITQTADSITTSVSATYETKTASAAKLTEAKNYAVSQDNAVKSTLNTTISQTESSIKSTVAAAYTKYDTSGISVNYYGYGSTPTQKASANTNKIYLDQATGYYYKSNGTSWVKQNSTPLKQITDKLNSKIDQTADEIKLEVAGQYLDAYDEWAISTWYNVGDIVRVVTRTGGEITDIDFYRCTVAHRNHRPPNSSYWESVSTPTVQNAIDVNLDGITLYTEGSPDNNSAKIELRKDGITMSAKTITMSNVVADEIVANSSITSPKIYDPQEFCALSFKSSSGYGEMIYGGSYSGQTISSCSFGIRYDPVEGPSYMYFCGKPVMRSRADSSYIYVGESNPRFMCYGTWDFSNATVIMPSSE